MNGADQILDDLSTPPAGSVVYAFTEFDVG
jgi:hypothetical protein